ncbi:MAG: PQQ-binding-like beta-propeller repeat protein [Planctomycetota bacterium]
MLHLLPAALPLIFAAPSAPSTASVGGEEPTDAATWLQWRGPERTGVVGGPAWPASLDSIEESWSVPDLGESYATPIVTREFVYTVATEDKAEEVVQAYDRATGELAWESRWKGAMEVPVFAAKNGSWIRSSPAYDGENLYVAGIRDVVVCLDGNDGTVRWRVDFSDEMGAALPKFGCVCSPLIVDGSLFIQAGESLARIDKESGEIQWRSKAGANDGGMGSAFSSPMMATLAGREQLVVQSRTHLAGIDPESGKELWSTPVKAFRGMNILTPQLYGDAVFTSAYGGRAHMFSVSADDGGMAVEEAWTARAQAYMSSPVVVNDHAFLFLRSNRFTCVGLEEGTDGWVSEPTGDEYWSLVAQGDKILALANTGILRLINATPAKYDVASEVPLVEGPSWAHLVVTAPVEGDEGADVFVRGQTSLHAFRWK